MIEEILIEQQNKMLGALDGSNKRRKYGHDYNILKAIIKHCKDAILVKNIVEDLEDNFLKDKVKIWMAL